MPDITQLDDMFCYLLCYITVPSALPGHILPPVPQSSQHPLEHSMSIDASEPPAPPPRPPHVRSMSVEYKSRIFSLIMKTSVTKVTVKFQ